MIDGVDGSGKSTLIKNIVDRWVGDIDSYFDPGISHHPAFAKWQVIRNFVKTECMEDETETLLFFALRQELMSQVEHSISHGRDAIIDRGYVSTTVYQGILKGQNEFIKRLETVINFRKPDVLFILNAPFEVLTERLEKRASNIDKFKSNIDFRKRVWEAYQNYINEHDDIIVIDASGSEENTYTQCMKHIEQWKQNLTKC
jgi:dTMP kinase